MPIDGCEHLSRTPAFDVITGKKVADVGLCTWGETHPASAEKLLDAPRWLQNLALAGHQWREGDCEGCPGFQMKKGAGHG